jgi:hypothetical protein
MPTLTVSIFESWAKELVTNEEVKMKGIRGEWVFS